MAFSYTSMVSWSLTHIPKARHLVLGSCRGSGMFLFPLAGSLAGGVRHRGVARQWSSSSSESSAVSAIQSQAQAQPDEIEAIHRRAHALALKCETAQDVVAIYHLWRKDTNITPLRAEDHLPGDATRTMSLPLALGAMLNKFGHHLNALRPELRSTLLRSGDEWHDLIRHGIAVATQPETPSDAARALQPIVRTYAALPVSMRYITEDRTMGLHANAFERMVRGAESAVARASASPHDASGVVEAAAIAPRDVASLLWSFARIYLLASNKFIVVKTNFKIKAFNNKKMSPRSQRATATNVRMEDLLPSRAALRSLTRSFVASPSAKPWEAANVILDLCTLHHLPSTRETVQLLEIMSGLRVEREEEQNGDDTDGEEGEMFYGEPNDDIVVEDKSRSKRDVEKTTLPRDAFATLRAAAHLCDLHGLSNMPQSAEESIARIVEDVVKSLRYTVGKRRHKRRADMMENLKHVPERPDISRVLTHLRSLNWRPNDDQLGTLDTASRRAAKANRTGSRMTSLERETYDALAAFAFQSRTGSPPTIQAQEHFENLAFRLRTLAKQAKEQGMDEKEEAEGGVRVSPAEWAFVPVRMLVDGIVGYALIGMQDGRQRSEAVLTSLCRGLGKRGIGERGSFVKASPKDLVLLYMTASYLEKTSRSTQRLGESLAYEARKAYEERVKSAVAPAEKALESPSRAPRRVHGKRRWIPEKDATEMWESRAFARELATELALTLAAEVFVWSPAANTQLPNETKTPKDASFWTLGRAAVHIPRASLPELADESRYGPRGGLVLPLAPSDVCHPLRSWHPTAETELCASMLRRLGFGPVVFARADDEYLSRSYHRGGGYSAVEGKDFASADANHVARAGASGERLRELLTEIVNHGDD